MDRKMEPIDIEKLIPHRGAMKLIETVVEVREKGAVTLSVAKADWPLSDGETVHPLVLIELAAQTSAVSIGWKDLQEGKGFNTQGFLVGIKRARFPGERIRVGSRIITDAAVVFEMENYTEILGTSRIDGEKAGEGPIAEITLQVVRTGQGEES